MRKSILSVIFLSTIALFLLAGFPIFLAFVVFPFFLYRQFVNILAHVIHGHGDDGLGKMLTTRSTFFLLDKMYTKPKSTLVLCFTFKGTIDISEVKKVFLNMSTELRHPKDKTLWYPEFQQYVFNFGGYSFWRKDLSFSIDDHVKYHSDFESGDRVATEEDLHKIRDELVHKPWRKNKPLWEMIFIPKYSSTKSATEDKSLDINSQEKPLIVGLFRMHHAMGDGQALFTLFANNILKSETAEIFPKAKKVETSLTSKVFFALSFPFTGAFALAKIITAGSKSPWTVEESRQTSLRHSLSPLLSVRKIKEIKDHYNVSFSSVIMAVVSGAHRELLIRKTKTGKVPQHVKCFCPFPLPNHSGKLRNYATVVIVELPVGEESVMKRLTKCHKIYEDIRMSPEPGVFSLISVLVGVFPRKIFRLLAMESSVSTGITSFPAGLKTHKFVDALSNAEVVDIYVGCGLLPGTTGVGFCIVSYKDGIRVMGGAYEALMTQSEINEFTLEIERQVELLHKGIFT